MEKYRIYIDEVGNSDLKSSVDPNNRYLSLTGVIFELNYIKEFITPSVENLKQKFFGSHPDEPIILHRKELVNKKYPFKQLKNPIIENDFNNELLSLLKNFDYTIITIVIDKLEHKNKYKVWKYDAYHYCLAVMVERFYKFLNSRYSVGDVMIESRGATEDKRLKKSYTKIFNEGTDYIRSDLFQKTLTSKELKVKPKSANISGLQIADLVAYPARQYVFDVFNIEKKEKATFNDKIIEVIKAKFLNIQGTTKGWGIKFLP